MVEIDTRVQFLKGVGETRAKHLEKLGIFSIGALLRYYPKRYEDWNTVTKISDDLLEEVTYICEYPVAVTCDYDNAYLTIPQEVAVTVMETHQRYFALYTKEGKLTNKFITITNYIGSEFENIKAGNLRVIKARLDDAVFFFNEDTKKPLESYREALKGMTFQKGMGSVYDKTERIAWGVDKAKNDDVFAKEYRIYELSQVEEKMPSSMAYQIPFRHLCNLLQTNSGDIEAVVASQKDIKPDQVERFRTRCKCAWYWITECAPEDFKFALREDGSKADGAFFKGYVGTLGVRKPINRRKEICCPREKRTQIAESPGCRTQADRRIEEHRC